METSFDVVNDRTLATAKSFLCKQEFSTYEQAVSAHMGGSFNLFEVLEGSPDDRVDASNYSNKRKEFCEITSSDARSSSYSNATVRSLNTHIASIYKDCVDKVSQNTGEAIAYIEPSSDLSSFKVHVVKSSGATEIDQFSAFPIPSSCTEGLLEASPEKPIEIRGSRQFQCVNSDPRRVVALSGNFKNDGKMFKHSKGEVPKREDNLDAISERLEALEKNLSLTGTKSGMVAFFTNSCPTSWAAYPDLEGRYVVGVPRQGKIGEGRGEALSNLENRAVGRHNHSIERRTYRQANRGGSSFAGGALEKVETEYTGEKEGTNAPYLQLLACIKE